MSNLAREELLERASAALETFETLGIKAVVRFKFTCEKCGERCTLVDINNLRENGECFKCGHVTEIKEGGFMLEATL